MASLGRIPLALAATLMGALLTSCGGSGDTTPLGAGGSSPAGGVSGQAGTPASGGSSQGGASGAGGTTTGGSGGMTCGPGCIQLCEGGLCDCQCTATCENFTAPAYDKSCTTDADCFAGIHTSDCCGSKVVLGYNIVEQDRFTSYEADCTARALCRCLSDSPRLESGQVTSDLEARFGTCNSGQCLGSGPVYAGAP
jgi:hypothetical protein